MTQCKMVPGLWSEVNGLKNSTIPCPSFDLESLTENGSIYQTNIMITQLLFERNGWRLFQKREH